MSENQEINLNETAAQIKARLKAEYPVLLKGSDEVGYEEMGKSEYDATIQEWVNFQLGLIAHEKAKIAAAEKKAELLDRLGITAEEAQLLLS
jgi:hypothetical protein